MEWKRKKREAKDAGAGRPAGGARQGGPHEVRRGSRLPTSMPALPVGLLRDLHSGCYSTSLGPLPGAAPWWPRAPSDTTTLYCANSGALSVLTLVPWRWVVGSCLRRTRPCLWTNAAACDGASARTWATRLRRSSSSGGSWRSRRRCGATRAEGHAPRAWTRRLAGTHGRHLRLPHAGSALA